MGFRFQKRFSLGKGARLNLNKRSTSVTFGGRVSRITLGTKGASSSFSIPGTGISYSTGHGPRRGGGLFSFLIAGAILFGALRWLFSSDTPTSNHSAETTPATAMTAAGNGAAQPAAPTTKRHPKPAPHTIATSARPASLPVPVAPTADSLAPVRSADANAAEHISAYCAGAAAKAIERVDSVEENCRRNEIAAWRRLVIQDEFPNEPANIVQICSQPPFPDSFVAKEVCAKFEMHAN
jgi:hypothetical protein